MKAALVAPWVPHLPYHPSVFLGYGTAVLAGSYELEVRDLNAEIYSRYRGKLKQILNALDKTSIASDAFLASLFTTIGNNIEKYYATISWKEYPVVYVTPPTWFPMVPAETVLRLTKIISRISPKTKLFFFGTSLGSWTNEEELRRQGVRTVHLNDLFSEKETPKPVTYDLLPNPLYTAREKYLFDLLPFTLKHGCPWGKCRFCSLSQGWNAGYLERSAKSVIRELETIVDHYDPKAFVCRDHSLNGRNLVEFSGYIKKFNKPWGGQSRADLSEKKIQLLQKAGCKGIFFGLESGSERVLRAMNKGITSKQMSDFIKRLHSNGIFAAPSLVIGLPEEKGIDFNKTIRFLTDHRQYIDFVNVYPFMPTPASEFGYQNKVPEKNMPLKLFKFTQTCVDLGMKVIFGEQSIEYFLFKKICNDLSPDF
jgi:hypothetical protein